MTLPTNTWAVILHENWSRQTYDVYLVSQQSDGTRIAYDGDRFHVVAEGAVSPRWLEVSKELLYDTNFMDAFKHVYVVEQTFKEWSQHVASNS